MGLLESRRDARLAPEPLLKAGVGRHLGTQQLDRHRAVFDGVVGAVHLAHPADAKQRLQLIRPEHRADAIGHTGLSQPGQQRRHPQFPPSLDQQPRPEPPARLLHRQTLCQSQQYMRHVGRDPPTAVPRRCTAGCGRRTPPAPTPRPPVPRARLEIGERPREHHLRQPRIRPAEQPEHRNQPLQIGDGSAVTGTLASSLPSSRKPSKNIARTRPALSSNSS